MKRLYIFVLILLSALYACNSAGKKTADKDTTTIRPKKVDSTQAITIDEPIPSGSPGDSNQNRDENKQVKKEEQKDTRLIFPHFALKVHDFRVNDTYQVYNHDTSAAELDIDSNNFWFINAKKDSLDLYGYSEDSFQNNLLEIIPNNKTDSFNVSYSLKESLNGIKDKTPVHWESRGRNKILKDSAHYFFRVPKHAYDNNEESILKKRLHLKDTLITYTDEYGPEQDHALIFKNTPCAFTTDNICLRIKRFAKGKLSGVKYIVFSLDDGDD